MSLSVQKNITRIVFHYTGGIINENQNKIAWGFCFNSIDS